MLGTYAEDDYDLAGSSSASSTASKALTGADVQAGDHLRAAFGGSAHQRLQPLRGACCLTSWAIRSTRSQPELGTTIGKALLARAARQLPAALEPLLERRKTARCRTSPAAASWQHPARAAEALGARSGGTSSVLSDLL